MWIPPLYFAEQVSKLPKSTQDTMFTEALLAYQSWQSLPTVSQLVSLSNLFFPHSGLTFGQFAMGWAFFGESRGSTLQTFVTPENCGDIFNRLRAISLQEPCHGVSPAAANANSVSDVLDGRGDPQNPPKPRKARR